MPTNVTPEYAAAQREYEKASTIEERIAALEKMLSTVPRHKGTENLRQDIKTKLAKLREKKEKLQQKKAKATQVAIKKEGAAQICIIGPPNSGKSTLLNKLTRAKVTISSYGFTTEKPEIGIMQYKGLKFQMIEIPPIIENSSEKDKQFMSLIRQADLTLIVTDTDNLDYFFREFKKLRILFNESEDDFATVNAVFIQNKTDLPGSEKVMQGLRRYYNIPLIQFSAIKGSIEDLKEEIWKYVGLIKVYTKEPGKKLRMDIPVPLKKGSLLKDMAAFLHKDFIKKFRFARIWGHSAKFGGQQVGLTHPLEDEDIVEIHLK